MDVHIRGNACHFGMQPVPSPALTPVSDIPSAGISLGNLLRVYTGRGLENKIGYKRFPRKRQYGGDKARDVDKGCRLIPCMTTVLYSSILTTFSDVSPMAEPSDPLLSTHLGAMHSESPPDIVLFSWRGISTLALVGGWKDRRKDVKFISTCRRYSISLACLVCLGISSRFSEYIPQGFEQSKSV